MKVFFIKITAILLFLLMNSELSAQFTKQEFNKKFVYQQQGHNWAFYFGNDALPYLQAMEPDSPLNGQKFIQNTLIYKERIVLLQGEVKAEKYFDEFSYSEFEREYFTGGKNYMLDKDFWDVAGKENLKMISTDIPGNKKIRLFFENQNDGVDYSMVTNSMLRVEAAPEISNFDQLLGKGWIMIYGENLYDDGASVEIATFKTSEKIEPFTLLIPNNLLDFHYYTKDVSKEEVELPYPVYCEVVGLNGGVDDETYSALINFFMFKCGDYDDWGRYVLEDYQKYFIDEIEKTASLHLKEGTLNAKQIEIFKKEAREYINSNRKENLMKDE